MNLNRVEALIMPGNIASEKVLLKLGFQCEGLLRQYAYFKDSFYDLQMFALLKQDWIIALARSYPDTPTKS
jgi:ribosomal-protein-alanine N-acetyltransferase